MQRSLVFWDKICIFKGKGINERHIIYLLLIKNLLLCQKEALSSCSLEREIMALFVFFLELLTSDTELIVLYIEILLKY